MLSAHMPLEHGMPATFKFWMHVGLVRMHTSGVSLEMHSPRSLQCGRQPGEQADCAYNFQACSRGLCECLYLHKQGRHTAAQSTGAHDHVLQTRLTLCMSAVCQPARLSASMQQCSLPPPELPKSCLNECKRERYRQVDESAPDWYLAKGTFGKVFIAADTKTGAVVAIKKQRYSLGGEIDQEFL